MNIILLQNHLKPIEKFLNDPSISEISINRPGEVWLERGSAMFCQSVPEFNLRHLKDLSQLIATYTNQQMNEEHPLLSAHLPQGYRVQIVYPPAVADETVAMSIRKPAYQDFTLDDYVFVESEQALGHAMEAGSKAALDALYQQKNPVAFLKLAMRQRCNILVSGGTSSGKTTFLNTLLKEIPDNERVITLEDVPEIRLSQPNGVSLFASRNQQGRAKIEMQHLVEASLRLRPDRIIIGELRGAEAFSFLRALNTGHPGSMATLHADNPTLAFEQLVLMVMQKNLGLTREQIFHYIHHRIDVIVQLQKRPQGGRQITDIYYRSDVEHEGKKIDRLVTLQE